MINAPKNDLPIRLVYNSFFFNACTTGLDYIENFKHGDYIYTTQSCFVHQGTRIYVQGLVEGKQTEQIVELLNQPNVGDPDPANIVYEYNSF